MAHARARSSPTALVSIPAELTALAPAQLPVTSDAPAGSPAAMYLGKLDPGASYRSQRNALAMLAAFLSGVLKADPLTFRWWEITYERSQQLRTQLISAERRRKDGTVQKYKPASINKMLCALRGVLLECMNLGKMSGEAYARISKIKGVTGSRVPAGRMIDDSEIDKLIGAAKTSKRDIAILAMLLGTGARRFELATMMMPQYDTSARSVRIIGKRNKERISMLPDWAIAPINAWIVERGSHPGLLFGLSSSGITWVIEVLQKKAGVAKFTTHDFRRTFISDAIGQTKDLVAIAAQVGHSNVTTTQKYDRRGEQAKRDLICAITPRKFTSSKD